MCLWNYGYLLVGWLVGCVCVCLLLKDRWAQKVSENFLKIGGHHILLLERTMILKRQNQRVRSDFESKLLNSLQHSTKSDFGGECVSVCDEGLPARPVPAVQLNTSRPMQ